MIRFMFNMSSVWIAAIFCLILLNAFELYLKLLHFLASASQTIHRYEIVLQLIR